MNELETKIIAAFHNDILNAATSARTGIVNDLYSFLGVIEKRIQLTTAEVKSVATSGYLPPFIPEASINDFDKPLPAAYANQSAQSLAPYGMLTRADDAIKAAALAGEAELKTVEGEVAKVL